MGFGFYYLAEYLNLFVVSGIASTVFLGGWAPFNIGVAGVDSVLNMIPGIVWFLGKTFAVVWLLMWVRWTFPRLPFAILDTIGDYSIDGGVEA